jgi:transcriptional regulator with XRE-family HTH domain
MARTALGWSRSELAEAANVAERTVSRFEDDETVASETVKALRAALEREGVDLIESGTYRGGVVPPMEGR